MSSGRGGGDGGGKVDGSGEVGVGSKEGWSGGVGTKEENGIVYISYTHGPVQAPRRGGARDESTAGGSASARTPLTLLRGPPGESSSPGACRTALERLECSPPISADDLHLSCLVLLSSRNPKLICCSPTSSLRAHGVLLSATENSIYLARYTSCK